MPTEDGVLEKLSWKEEAGDMPGDAMKRTGMLQLGRSGFSFSTLVSSPDTSTTLWVAVETKGYGMGEC